MIVSEIKLYELLKAKLGQQEAEAFVQILESKVDQKFEDAKDVLATKGDILLTKADLKTEIADVKSDLIDRMHKTEIRTILWIVGVGVLQIAIKYIFKI